MNKSKIIMKNIYLYNIYKNVFFSISKYQAIPVKFLIAIPCIFNQYLSTASFFESR